MPYLSVLFTFREDLLTLADALLYLPYSLFVMLCQ